MLIIGRDGVIRHANDAATQLLGAAVGRRCGEVVRAHDLHGLRVCGANCPAHNPTGRLPRDRTVAVRLRGELWDLVSSTMGTDNVVALVRATATENVATEQLTPRERDVMALVARGMSTNGIASRLGLASATVRTHVEHVRQKLGAHTRAEAVARLLAETATAAK